jgi:hypothetical protein
MSEYENIQQQTETLNVTKAQSIKSFFVTGTVQMQIGSKISQETELPHDLREVKLEERGRKCIIYIPEKDIEAFKELFQQQPAESPNR